MDDGGKIECWGSGVISGAPDDGGRLRKISECAPDPAWQSPPPSVIFHLLQRLHPGVTTILTAMLSSGFERNRIDFSI